MRSTSYVRSVRTARARPKSSQVLLLEGCNRLVRDRFPDDLAAGASKIQ
jgi:hypothetical protein